MRRLLLPLLVLLPGCGAVGAPGAPVLAGVAVVEGVALRAFGRTTGDALVSLVTGEDCSIARIGRGEAYCGQDGPPPPQPVCTRSLGAVDCWTVPPAAWPPHRGVADGPATLTAAQENDRIGWVGRIARAATPAEAPAAAPEPVAPVAVILPAAAAPAATPPEAAPPGPATASPPQAPRRAPPRRPAAPAGGAAPAPAPQAAPAVPGSPAAAAPAAAEPPVPVIEPAPAPVGAGGGTAAARAATAAIATPGSAEPNGGPAADLIRPAQRDDGGGDVGGAGQP
jgi:hypothetical protein